MVKLKAQNALDDAWDAINDLEAGSSGWRQHWKSAVSSLYTVRDILKDEDSKQSKIVADVLRDRYDEHWEPDDGESCFIHFIRPIRNDIQHENGGIPERKVDVYGDGEVVNVNLFWEDGGDALAELNEAASWVESELAAIVEEIEEREDEED